MTQGAIRRYHGRRIRCRDGQINSLHAFYAFCELTNERIDASAHDVHGEVAEASIPAPDEYGCTNET